jgi:hypothetical protein
MKRLYINRNLVNPTKILKNSRKKYCKTVQRKTLNFNMPKMVKNKRNQRIVPMMIPSKSRIRIKIKKFKENLKKNYKIKMMLFMIKT